ncbi:MAG: ribonuclease P protein component [Cyanobacteria bacterium P01_A01_bin.83]
MPSAHRLKNHQDYRTVYEQGIRRYSPHLTLVALHNAGNRKQEVTQSEITGCSALAGQRKGHGERMGLAPQEEIAFKACSCPTCGEPNRLCSPYVPPITPTKIGISIGKKVSKKAVVRNRIKRQIKSAITSNLSKMAPGWKIVIVVRPEAIKCKYEHFLRELEELLKQAKIINGY